MMHMYLAHPSTDMSFALEQHSQQMRLNDENNYNNNNNHPPPQDYFPSASPGLGEETVLTQLFFQKTQLLLNIFKIILAIVVVSLDKEGYLKKYESLSIWCGCIAILAGFEMILNIYNIYTQREIQRIRELNNEGDNMNDSAIIEVPLITQGRQQNAMSLFSLERLKHFSLKIAGSKNEFLAFVLYTIHFILFIYGNAQLQNSQDLKDILLYKVAFIYLLVGYLVFCIPLMCCLLLILYLPFILIGYLIFRRNIIEMLQEGSHKAQTQPISEEKLSQLKSIRLTPFSDAYLNKECVICIKTYNIHDTLMLLPCSIHHHFHRDCIKKWLRINSQCPICRYDVNNAILELKDLKQSNISQASTSMVIQGI